MALEAQNLLIEHHNIMDGIYVLANFLSKSYDMKQGTDAHVFIVAALNGFNH